MRAGRVSWLKSQAAAYMLVGAACGLVFPIAAIIFELAYNKLPVSFASFVQLQKAHPLLWVIDSAPFVLGYVASLAGKREDRLRDVTSLLEHQVRDRTAELQREHQFFHALVANSPLAIVSLDNEQVIISCNPAFEKLFGYREAEIVGKELDALITTKDTRNHAKDLTERVEAGETVYATAQRRRKDGSFVEVEIHGVPIMVRDEKIGVFAIYNDVSERRRAEDALTQSEARYRSLFEASPISLWEEDFSAVKTYLEDLKQSGVSDLRPYLEQNPDEVAKCVSLVKILDVNAATVELYRAESKEGLFKGLSAVLGEDSMAVFREELLALAGGSVRFEAEIAQYTLAGGTILGALRLSVAPGYEDTWGKVFVSVLDITERKRLEERLRESLSQMETLAHTDPLTGLLNRRAIMEHALSELARAQRVGSPLGLALIDLDHLKEINDRYGHLTGDAILCMVADTLHKSCRPYDRVGRWGGDEFMVVLPGVDLTTATSVGDRLRRRVREASLPLPLGGRIEADLCVGVTAGLPDHDPQTTLELMLGQADEALYKAKYGGRSRVCAFEKAA